MKETVDLAIINANIYNSYFKRFDKGILTVLNGKFYYKIPKKTESFKARKIIDIKNKYIIPGLIDIHMHIESSMLPPQTFSNEALKNGTTTIVSEPHEMANVKGLEGVQEMIKAAEKSLIDIYYGIPSSVPTTSPHLETTGGYIDKNEMEALYKNKRVKCVGEVMNYRKIITNKNNLEISKFINELRKYDKIFPIEGHCPKLINEELARFLYHGINSDHTEHTFEEFKQRFEQGMFIELQEKTLSTKILKYIIKNNLYEYFCFVTDDVMIDTLINKGHLNYVINKAIKMGFPIEYAIYCSTYTAAKRMNLLDRGIISPGKKADFIIVDLLQDNTLKIENTFIDGKCYYTKGEALHPNTYKFPKSFYKSINLRKLNTTDFKYYTPIKNGKQKVRVINVNSNSTKTTSSYINVTIKNGEIQNLKNNLLFAFVFNRYTNNFIKPSFALITGDCIKQGAVATTYAHDAHNLLVIGDTIENIILCANKVIEMDGGLTCANENKITASLQLNINGLLSENNAKEVAKEMENIRNQLIIQGYNHYNPIMSLCTLSLLVSPTLKLSDKGLIDVDNSEIVSLFC